MFLGLVFIGQSQNQMGSRFFNPTISFTNHDTQKTLTQSTRSLIFMTWNVRGLNNPQKIRNVFAYLDRHKVDVACIQETHLTQSSEDRVGTRWASFRKASSYSTYARGVLILIKRGIPFTLLISITDDQGRYIITQGNFGGTILTLVNTYGPNIDDPAVFVQIWAKL